MYPEKFDSNKLTADDNTILEEYAIRRKSFNKYLKDNGLKLFTCPGCGFPTLNERGHYGSCAVCDWEDDNQDDENADEIWGGPNKALSLTENRLNIGIKLKQLADSLNGKLNDNKNEVISILANHNLRMENMSNKIPFNTSSSDPIWTEFEQEREKVLYDLIKK